MSHPNPTSIEDVDDIIPLPTALFFLFAIGAGTLAGTILLQTWLPGLTGTLLGPEPKAYWDLARTSGIAAYLLMWASVVLGLVITNRMAQLWHGGPTVVELHQFTSLLSLGFALFHGLILLGDQYVQYSLLQIIIPFAGVNYKPFWVGLGQIAFYLLIPITFSFYFRRSLGPGLWRALHYGTFIVYALVTVHGLLSGTDTSSFPMLMMYAVTGSLVGLLTLYRIRSLDMVRA